MRIQLGHASHVWVQPSQSEDLEISGAAYSAGAPGNETMFGLYVSRDQARELAGELLRLAKTCQHPKAFSMYNANTGDHMTVCLDCRLVTHLCNEEKDGFELKRIEEVK